MTEDDKLKAAIAKIQQGGPVSDARHAETIHRLQTAATTAGVVRRYDSTPSSPRKKTADEFARLEVSLSEDDRNTFREARREVIEFFYQHAFGAQGGFVGNIEELFVQFGQEVGGKLSNNIPMRYLLIPSEGLINRNPYIPPENDPEMVEKINQISRLVRSEYNLFVNAYVRHKEPIGMTTVGDFRMETDKSLLEIGGVREAVVQRLHAAFSPHGTFFV